MTLVWLILIPTAGAMLAWLAGRRSAPAARWTALAAAAAQLALIAAVWVSAAAAGNPGLAQPMRFSAAWIPQFGIRFSLAMDGLSMLLVALTAVLGVLSVAASWRGPSQRVGLFHLHLLWSLAAVTGIFLAEDLFLFYFFWEMVLIPLYFLIRIWGLADRVYASLKFFLFTQAGGLLLLAGILALYFIHGRSSGNYTFDFRELTDTAMAPQTGMWLMLAFFAAFAVKIPAVGVHTWLPDAHSQAPVAGSVVLAGLVLKVGAYGVLRFVPALFPQAALQFAPVAMALAVAAILYGAMLAAAQRDLKRLIAYTSVSHMGFVLLGAFSLDAMALQGALIVMLAHGLSTGGLFLLAGMLHERIDTYNLRKMGGLWRAMPRLGGAAMFLALATLGLPGLGNFVGEWLVLQGVWRVAPWAAAVASAGFVLSTVYSLRMMQRVFFGSPREQLAYADISKREGAILGSAMALLLWLGLYPQTFLDASAAAMENIRAAARSAAPAKGTAAHADATALKEGDTP